MRRDARNRVAIGDEWRGAGLRTHSPLCLSRINPRGQRRGFPIRTGGGEYADAKEEKEEEDLRGAFNARSRMRTDTDAGDRDLDLDRDRDLIGNCIGPDEVRDDMEINASREFGMDNGGGGV